MAGLFPVSLSSFRSRPQHTKMVGVADERRRYDLPLNKDPGSSFLRLLLALMSCLAILALAGSFLLGALNQKWSQGLESHYTIEIPAALPDGRLLGSKDIERVTAQMAERMESHPVVKNVEIKGSSEILDMVGPWLGDEISLPNLPVPGLLTITVAEETGPENIKALENRIKSVSDHARLVTHEDWLADLARFTTALRTSAFFISTIVLFTVAVAIGGAVRSRLRIHSDEIEILHLMGAEDRYISRQFQRHIFILAIQGALIGLLMSAFIMKLIDWMAGEMDIQLLPEASLGQVHIIILCLMPLFLAILARTVAGHAVQKELGSMI